MIRQGFYVGKNGWYVMVYYDIRTKSQLEEVKIALRTAGASDETVDEAVENLSYPDTGFTFSNFRMKFSAMFISRATSPEEMYDTIQHELKHVVEHISEYYDVDSKGEKAAYLQGEIARQMFPAAAMVVCPCCHGKE